MQNLCLKPSNRSEHPLAANDNYGFEINKAEAAEKAGDKEATRAALQSIVACGGAAASGQGDCGSAAMGAAASVVLNNILDKHKSEKSSGEVIITTSGIVIENKSLEEQQDRENLVAGIIALISSGSGADITSILNAAKIETENNKLHDIKTNSGNSILACTAHEAACSNSHPISTWKNGTDGEKAIWNEFASKLSGEGDSVIEAAINNFIVAAINHDNTSKNIIANNVIKEKNEVLNNVAGDDGNLRSQINAGIRNGSIDYKNIKTLSSLKTEVSQLSAEDQQNVIALIKDISANGSSGDGAYKLLSGILSSEDQMALIKLVADPHFQKNATDIEATAAFVYAFGKGVGTQGYEDIKGLAKLIGNAALFAADTSVLGDGGDYLKSLLKSQGVPDYVLNNLPSAERGENTKQYLNALSDAITEYMVSRASDPAKFKSDAMYVIEKYSDEYTAEYNKVKDDPTALAAFYGEISGRVALEMAMFIVPASKVAEVANVGSKATDAVNVGSKAALSTDEAVELGKTDKLHAMLARTEPEANNASSVVSKGDYDAYRNANWKPEGLNALDISQIPVAQSMMKQLIDKGISYSDAERYVKGYFASGSTLPVETVLNKNTQLVKVVPTGESVGANSAYWFTKAELDKFGGDIAKLIDSVALPPSSHAASYDVYMIRVRKSATVYTSEIAPANNGINNPAQTGKAIQTIVVDRSKFTAPIKIKTFP